MNLIDLLRENIERALKEELSSQEKLMGEIKKLLSNIDAISVTSSNKSDMALVVRVDDKEEIDSIRKKIRAVLKQKNISIEDRLIPKYDPSIDCTVAENKDGSGRVYVVYKYDIGSREGLALEHVVQFLLTRKITDELKNRLDLPPEAGKQEVKEKLRGDFADTLEVALKGKALINQKIGQVISADSVGSTNNKADLILTTQDGRRVGLSIKLVTEEGRGVRFTYNKNLGYGDETDDNLVRNPSGKPWWMVGRQIFASKIGSRKYNPGAEEYEVPSWMEKAKETHSDIYKEAMSEVYEKIRDVLTANLRRLKLKELVDMVNEAHLGAKEERGEYDDFFVLTSTSKGVKLEHQGGGKPDIQKLQGMNKNDIVRQEDSNIVIDIPGLEPLTIHSVKFHSNMLSSDKQGLKIKTR